VLLICRITEFPLLFLDEWAGTFEGTLKGWNIGLSYS
jgi:hypothetical protein